MTTTSDCAAFEATLPDYLDGTLADDGAARAHIVSCESCRALVRDMERIRARAAALPALHPPRDLWAGIEARIQTIPQEIAPRRPLATRWLSQRWYGAPLARAAVLIIATASVTLLAAHRALHCLQYPRRRPHVGVHLRPADLGHAPDPRRTARPARPQNGRDYREEPPRNRYCNRRKPRRTRPRPRQWVPRQSVGRVPEYQARAPAHGRNAPRSHLTDHSQHGFRRCRAT